MVRSVARVFDPAGHEHSNRAVSERLVSSADGIGALRGLITRAVFLGATLARYPSVTHLVSRTQYHLIGPWRHPVKLTSEGDVACLDFLSLHLGQPLGRKPG